MGSEFWANSFSWSRVSLLSDSSCRTWHWVSCLHGMIMDYIINLISTYLILCIILHKGFPSMIRCSESTFSNKIRIYPSISYHLQLRFLLDFPHFSFRKKTSNKQNQQHKNTLPNEHQHWGKKKCWMKSEKCYDQRIIGEVFQPEKGKNVVKPHFHLLRVFEVKPSRGERCQLEKIKVSARLCCHQTNA